MKVINKLSRFFGYAALPLAVNLAYAETALEEVIITAQKRAESLQDTPIAVTAFTSDTLQKNGIDNISQIADFTPNMTFDTTAVISGSSSAAVVFIRGVGQTNFQVTNDPGVGTYIDGVYMSSSIGGVMDIIDVERIEVLRGPQGTLFGRNTIGGAINITTEKPASEEGGYVEFTMGNYNRINVRGSIDLPLTENLLSKWSIGSKRADGYLKVRAPGGSSTVSTGNFSDGLERSLRDLGDDNEVAARVSFLYTPTDTLTVSLAVDTSKIDEASAASSLAGVQVPLAGTTLGLGTSFYNNFDAAVVDVPGLGAGILYDERWVSDNPEDETFKTGPNGTDIDIWGVAGTVEWEIDENLIMKSISAYRRTDANFNRDPDGSPLQFTHTSNDFDHEQFSQEFQLVGDSSDGAVRWIAGVYYFEEDATDDLRAPLAPSIGTVVINADIKNTSVAVFGQATWNITDALALTLGLRHTKDEREMFPDFFYELEAGGAFAGQRNVPLERVSETFEQTTPRFSFDYQLYDDLLIYFSYSEGYKSGGFNSRTTAFRADGVLEFEPEELETFEVGMKWQGFDDRLRVNTAAFFSDYTNVQVTVIEDIAPGTQNGGEVEIQGFELEVTALPTENLQINFGLGWIDAEYVELVALTPGVPPISQIDIDNQLVNTPELTSTLGLEYMISLDSGDLVLRADWTYTDEVYNDDANSEILRAPSNNIYNAQIAYEKDNWQVTLWGKNLSDERFITGGDANFIIGFLEANYNMPRTYGVTLRRSF